MKTKFLSLLAACLIIGLGSCKKDLIVNHGIAPVPEADVYVAGFVNSPLPEAAYWKNGVLTTLTSSPSFAMAHSIAVQNGNVYVAGSIGAVTENAVYWLNGNIVQLGAPAVNSEALAIAVQGSDVYVAGWVHSDVSNQLGATYWKNGVATSLTGVTARAIAVDGADVYIAGSVMSAGQEMAAYWKNGVVVNLTEGFEASAIAVSGTDVYVAGSTPNGSVVYWKNGTVTTLVDGSANATVSTVGAMAVSGPNVFIAAGIPDGDNGLVPVIWKNGVEQTLTAPTTIASHPSNNLATGVALFLGDVYATGGVINNTTQKSEAFYWKNGTATQLDDGGSGRAYASSIAVVQR